MAFIAASRKCKGCSGRSGASMEARLSSISFSQSSIALSEPGCQTDFARSILAGWRGAS